MEGSPHHIDPRKIIAGSIVFAFDNRKSIGLSILPAFSIYFLCAGLEITGLSEVQYFATALVAIMAQVLIAVTIHRSFLKPGSVDNVTESWRWTRSEWRYLYKILGLSVIAAPALLLHLIPYLGFALAPLVVAWIWARGSMALPAAALGENLDVATSWRDTADYNRLLLVTLVAFPIALLVPVELLYLVSWGWIPSAFLEIATTVIATGVLSLTYREIYRDHSTAA